MLGRLPATMRRYMCEEIEEKNLPVLDARRPWLAKDKGIVDIYDKKKNQAVSI